MILSHDVQNNLDVHSNSGMCQITHRICFVLRQSFHFQGACLCCHTLFPPFYYALINLISEVCVCIYSFGCFVMTGGMKMRKKSFYPSVLVAEGMNAHLSMREILNLWF